MNKFGKVIQLNSAVAVLTSLVSISTLAAAGSAFAAAGQTLQVVDGNVGFLAVGKPSAIKIRGKGAAPKGDLHIAGKDVTGDLNFDVNSLNTGIEMRDRHMKEKYLQVDKFPTAQFKITKLALPADFTPNGFRADKVPFEGDLTLHGVTKPVKGIATISGNAGSTTGHMEFRTQITDYGIEIPNYMGVKVADKVDVDVDVVAKPTAAPSATHQGTKKK